MKCRNPKCGLEHPAHVRCEVWAAQRAASNSASNGDSNASNHVASNTIRTKQGNQQLDKRVHQQAERSALRVSKDTALESVEPVRKQRWSREAYNAYQRMFMACKRAVLAGRAEWIK